MECPHRLLRVSGGDLPIVTASPLSLALKIRNWPTNSYVVAKERVEKFYLSNVGQVV